jgi:hypothetical protein
MVPSSASRGVPNPRMESVPDSGASFCGFLFTTVGALRPSILEGFGSVFFDSIGARLNRICSVRSGAPLSGNCGQRVLTESKSVHRPFGPNPLTAFFIARFVYNIPIPVERVIIFPMAIIPNLFGVWNMLQLASRERTRLPLGIHGASLPFIIAPAGFLPGRSLGFLHTTHYGFMYFGVVEFHYTFLAVVFPVALIVYYLVWKYLIRFCNRIAGIAQ